MTTIAVVPVQGLGTAKSRLAGVLSAAQRRCLVLSLLRTVLDALTSSAVDATLVVSPDPAVLARARELGASAVEQRGVGLNEAIALGRAEASRLGADRLLVVLGDLPLLRAGDVDGLLGLPGPVVLAPDRHGMGTNLLALTPPDALTPVFGADSLAAFRAAALGRGLSVREWRSTGTEIDLDTPDDLTLLRSAGCDLPLPASQHPAKSV